MDRWQVRFRRYWDHRGSNLGTTQILIYYGKPSPFSLSQEIFIDFIPQNTYVDSGVWKINLIPGRIVDGRYNLWMPGGAALNEGTRFLFPVPEITLTIPSTAGRVISVGAYNSRYQAYADFSGRGFTRVTNLVKPDIAAPAWISQQRPQTAAIRPGRVPLLQHLLSQAPLPF